MRLSKYLPIALFLIVFQSSMVFADSPTQAQVVAESASSITPHTAIHTYGGGELFKKVFNAIAMLIYGNSSSGLGQTFNGILRITLIMGGFAGVCLALLREKVEQLIKGFFLPALAITQLILIPRTDVYIQDHLIQNDITTSARAFEKVSNVPYLLAHIASTASTISHKLTEALEGVAHGADDDTYNWTGHIYAADSFFKLKKHRIVNREVEENFREFCRECVWRDVSLGLYSREDLVNEPKILDFLQENTSKVRSVRYRDSKEGNPRVEFFPCNEALDKITKDLNGANEIRELVLGETQGSISSLLNQSKKGKADLENLLKQQAAIEILKEETPGTLQSFAAKRAELQQNESQKILGALGASSIVAMHNFFEAIVYMIFPIIILISLLSFGVKSLVSWLQFVLWVNVWPPFYVVVNFLLTSIWNFRKAKHFGSTIDLTIVNSEGLTDLYNSMESIAAITMAFIPFLSWALIRGGVSSMVHLASSLTSPAQAAAASAASEKVSGNYSLGNVSLNNTNGMNQEMFKQSSAGRLSQGFVAIDQGEQTTTLAKGGERLYTRQNDSYLREGISKSTAFNHAVQDQLQSSESTVKEQSQQTVNSATASANKALGVMESFTENQQSGHQLSYQEMNGQQRTVQEATNLVEDYASSYGMTKDSAAREMAEVGLTAFGTGFKGTMSDGHSKMEGESYADKVSKSENFMGLLQEMSTFNESDMGSILRSEDMRHHSDFVESWNATKSSADQVRVASSQQENLSNLESFAKSDNLSIHQNLNQRFVDFLSDKFDGDTSLMNQVLEAPTESAMKRGFVDEFVQDWAKTSPSTEWGLEGFDSLSSQMDHTAQATVTEELHGQERASYEKGSVATSISTLSNKKQEASKGEFLDYAQGSIASKSQDKFSEAQSMVKKAPPSALELESTKRAVNFGKALINTGKALWNKESPEDILSTAAGYEKEKGYSFGQGEGLFLSGEVEEGE